MAQVRHWEFAQEQGLAPGEKRWVQLGSWEEYRRGAVAVSAVPRSGDGRVTVLKVDNVNITRILKDPPSLSIDGGEYYAGCHVTNTGKTTVRQWLVIVGVIVP